MSLEIGKIYTVRRDNWENKRKPMNFGVWDDELGKRLFCGKTLSLSRTDVLLVLEQSNDGYLRILIKGQYAWMKDELMNKAGYTFKEAK